MLPRQLGGVVDARLKVYGTRNLRVIDAAVPPVSFSAHLMSVTYGLAEIGAEMVLSDYAAGMKSATNQAATGGSRGSSGSTGSSGSSARVARLAQEVQLVRVGRVARRVERRVGRSPLPMPRRRSLLPSLCHCDSPLSCPCTQPARLESWIVPPHAMHPPNIFSMDLSIGRSSLSPAFHFAISTLPPLSFHRSCSCMPCARCPSGPVSDEQSIQGVSAQMVVTPLEGG